MRITEVSAMTLPDVYRLEKECFSHPWSMDSLEESFYNPNARFFVCKAPASEENREGGPANESTSEQVVGYISFYQIRDEAFLNNVAVTAAFRRQGVGTALVKRAAEEAKANGASFLSLEVRRSNQAAIRLYEDLGFDLEGVRKKFYRDPQEDAFLYTLHFEKEVPPCCADTGKVDFI
ncbi:MAG TPA: ribosomal protein S18-alanine N-acetyltransferase [Clostridiales bacterium]|nr:ribosomal protein S18-alanine N-acetyltransferase [Clostridiales bacterium]